MKGKRLLIPVAIVLAILAASLVLIMNFLVIQQPTISTTPTRGQNAQTAPSAQERATAAELHANLLRHGWHSAVTPTSKWEVIKQESPTEIEQGMKASELEHRDRIRKILESR